MNTYGRAAVLATEMAVYENPDLAWKSATNALFLTEAARQKGCPKGAFLGLCEEGLVSGVKPGQYTRSKKNKAYALRAVVLLRNGAQPKNSKELWSLVMNNQTKAHNSQCDVVLALWHDNLISSE